MTKKSSFTFKLSEIQQNELEDHLNKGNYELVEIPHTKIAAKGPGCTIALYKSGKCLVQGKGGHEWVTFVLEPTILLEAVVGYEDVLEVLEDPASNQPHMGIDESGKGDFFGSLVIAAVYVDEKIAGTLREMEVRDSKLITNDKKALAMASNLRKLLGHRFSIITIGPRAYNRLYTKIGNVNEILAWGHARAIEELLEKVPDCPRAVSDQFGPKRQIEQALMKKGQKIKLEQRPKAESDPAVAAASILARAGFLHSLKQMKDKLEVDFPKGASPAVVEAAKSLVKSKGPDVLLDVAKCHFRTADKVLEQVGFSRADLGPEGAATSKAMRK